MNNMNVDSIYFQTVNAICNFLNGKIKLDIPWSVQNEVATEYKKSVEKVKGKQCIGQTCKGKQCSRHVKYGGQYCCQHKKKYIKGDDGPISVSGLGGFGTLKNKQRPDINISDDAGCVPSVRGLGGLGLLKNQHKPEIAIHDHEEYAPSVS